MNDPSNITEQDQVALDTYNALSEEQKVALPALFKQLKERADKENAFLRELQELYKKYGVCFEADISVIEDIGDGGTIEDLALDGMKLKFKFEHSEVIILGNMFDAADITSFRYDRMHGTRNE